MTETKGTTSTKPKPKTIAVGVSGTGSNLKALEGKRVVLFIEMSDANLYGFRLH